MSVPGMLARIESACAALDRVQKALRFSAGALRRSEAPGIDGALYLATAEVELRRARDLAGEAMAAIDLATATPERAA